jgi:hypothetical protein
MKIFAGRCEYTHRVILCQGDWGYCISKVDMSSIKGHNIILRQRQLQRIRVMRLAEFSLETVKMNPKNGMKSSLVIFGGGPVPGTSGYIPPGCQRDLPYASARKFIPPQRGGNRGYRRPSSQDLPTIEPPEIRAAARLLPDVSQPWQPGVGGSLSILWHPGRLDCFFPRKTVQSPDRGFGTIRFIELPECLHPFFFDQILH